MKNSVNNIRQFMSLIFIFSSWFFLARILKIYRVFIVEKNTVKKVEKLVFLSSHPEDPFASKGDEAMLVSAVSRVRSLMPGVEVSIVVCPNFSNKVSENLNQHQLIPLAIWGRPWNLFSIFSKIQKFDSCLCIGADVMDGYYSDIKSLRLWILSDLMACLNRKVNILGFSFNQAPEKYTRFFLRNCLQKTGLKINVRDSLSLSRVLSVIKPPMDKNIQLVSDLAFMLEPISGVCYEFLEVEQWFQRQRAVGRKVLAINIHPMLFPNRDDEFLGKVVASISSVISRLIQSENCSVLLVPHDFRGPTVGDLSILKKVYRSIRADHDFFKGYFTHATAAELKQMVSKVDLVITGRMHLAIAALGVGVPILGIVYQGKFEGLLRHFDLPDSILLMPEDLVEERGFYQFCVFGVNKAAYFKRHVEKKTPMVKKMSFDNIENFLFL